MQFLPDWIFILVGIFQARELLSNMVSVTGLTSVLYDGTEFSFRQLVNTRFVQA